MKKPQPLIAKTYGKIEFDQHNNRWAIVQAEPHVSIKLKNNFPGVPVYSIPPYYFRNNPENCCDLLWFMGRYPLAVSSEDLRKLKNGRAKHISQVNEIEQILTPNYKSLLKFKLRPGEKARRYQLAGVEAYMQLGRLLNSDEMGLGKTLIGILSFLNPKYRPGLVVCQTHMPEHWQDQVHKFTTLKVHIIKKGTPYNLPVADVYIMKYGYLAGWVNFFSTKYFKSAVCDEIQELRRKESKRYEGALVLRDSVEYQLFLSGTPMYNYGNEIWNILNALKKDALDTESNFIREWCKGTEVVPGRGYPVSDPKALGSYLRESKLMIRRTRADVKIELPPVNRIIHTIGYDTEAVRAKQEIAKTLARTVLEGDFVEQGMAARELSILARWYTGIAKAKEATVFIEEFFLKNDKPVVVAAWHREVYSVIARELGKYNPVFYTGTESTKQKRESKRAFMNRETNLFVISLRSAVGIDGLQNVCEDVVHLELDYSPMVHKQVLTRVDRPGQMGRVNEYYLICNCGSDPAMVDILGLKSSQAHGILDPMLAAGAAPEEDKSRMKRLAQEILSQPTV